MSLIKKTLTALLIVLVIYLGLPQAILAQNGKPKDVTAHSPEVWTSQEEKIPVELVEKKTSKWVWIGLGALLLAGGAAAAAGGGGGDDAAPPSDPAPTTGDVTVTW